MTSFWVNNGETLLFIGDSITDCGRRTTDMPLGSGYVRIFTQEVTAHYPERAITYINKGISGNRITQLHERWHDDVIRLKPDRLAIKIGINDLASDLRDAPDAVPPELFEQLYDDILDITRRELACPVVLLTPFYISTDTSGHTLRSRFLEKIPDYIAVVERMSRKYDTLLVPLHEIFQMHLQYRDADTFCPEPVHPNPCGHLIIARALFDVLSPK